MNAALFTSNRDNWETPQALFDQLNGEFHFTLDAAADDHNHKCEAYFTKETNGLEKRWEGVCILQSSLRSANRKVGDESQYISKELRCDRDAVAGTDTKWFHDYILGKAEIRFIRGRIRFSGHAENAPFPSMVVIFR